MIRTILIMGLIAFFFTVTGCGGGGGSGTGGSSSPGEIDGSSTGGERNPVCSAGQSSGEVRRPEFVRNLTGQTSWFASPIVADLDGDNENELIAAYYSLYVFSQSGDLIDRVDGNGSRIYAPTWWWTWKETARLRSSAVRGGTYTPMNGETGNFL